MLDLTSSRECYLRVWPRLPRDNQFQSRVRWQCQTQGSQEYLVQFNRRHGAIPMALEHYRLWDTVRTQVALGERPGDQVWAGMAQDHEGRWQQDLAWVMVMDQDRVATVLCLIGASVLAEGRARAVQPNAAYQDWTFTRARSSLA